MHLFTKHSLSSKTFIQPTDSVLDSVVVTGSLKISDHVERHFAEAIIWTLSPVVSEGSVIALELTFVVGADQNK